MNRTLLDKIVNAVLYEGHILYPYRPSSKKNRQRFTFGRVYPRAYSVAQNGAEACFMQTECLVAAAAEGAARVHVTVRFLQPILRETFGPAGEACPGWHEAVERTLELPPLPATTSSASRHPFRFSAEEQSEPALGEDGTPRGTIVRRRHALEGVVETTVEPLEPGLCKLRVRVLNETPMAAGDLSNSDAVLMRLFASTHTILHVEGGAFLSLLDPPPAHAAAVAQCQNIGAWPVLVGDEKSAERDTLLASPIILYDYPRIAPESAGDLFDATEIDEILTLRVLTMTDEEKAEMRAADPQARRILERTEALPPGDFLKMHGAMRDALSAEEFFNPPREASAVVQGVRLKAGDRVRICPKRRADLMDIALAGRIAIIEAVEQDVADQVHFALVVEDDPGREFGMTRYPGHRFFFSSDEIEPLVEEAAAK